MTTALVLFCICAVAFIVMAIVSKLSNKWGKLPHFIYNYIGGVWAVCSITDYRKALESQSFVKARGAHYILVPETIAFGSHVVIKDEDAQHFSGDTNYRGMPWADKGSFDPAEENFNLFVPFASQQHMPFTEQEQFFVKPQDPVTFSSKKREENWAGDYRLRFATHNWRWRFETWRNRFGIATVLMVFVVMFAGIDQMEKRSDAEEVVSLVNAQGGTVEQIKTTGQYTYRLMVRNDDGWNSILHGSIVRVQYVGGGSSRACLQVARSSQYMCGFVDSSLRLQQGDDAYLREGKVLIYGDTKTLGFDQEIQRWFITKDDSQKLLATGKFELAE